MGKNKLKKFSDMNTFGCVFQYPFAALQSKGFPMKGRWRQDYFKNDNPIVLELGCGKGEYTVNRARHEADKNFIGIDIKGARMWTGAKQAVEEQLSNVAFLRTDIELLSHFFENGEVDEIWITFPDPQMKKTRKRLTSTRFLNLYSSCAAPDALINLKTDSPFLFTYTSRLVEANNLRVIASTGDLYNSPILNDILGIRTFYEQQWIERGLSIKYLCFELNQSSELHEIDDSNIEPDTYRSFSRGQLQNREYNLKS